MEQQRLEELIAAHRPGYALGQPFYTDPIIHRRELERFFLDAWLYAGHESELPAVGDYLLVTVAGESVIVVHSAEDTFHALVNVCRHRGSRICATEKGHVRRLVCPYHGWTYGLDGALVGAREMGPDFDPSAYGLQAVAVERLEGMLFVNLATEPAPFDPLRKAMSAPLAPYGLAQTRVAHRQAYRIAGNWKLALENYCECYHCAPAHPEYAAAHALADPRHRWKVSEAEANAGIVAAGMSAETFDRAWLSAGAFGGECQHDRYPLREGYLTGSKSGDLLAPLLGGFREPVAVATDIQLGPCLFGLVYCDHAVLYRFLPESIGTTVCDVSWLVRADAESGRDYDLAALTWLWDVTTRADQRIIEANQDGVRSRFYRPGPLSTMETFQARFIDWYLARLGAGAPSA
ncbi:MAG: aromatic ring-hydroxylating dioxygenase subunit alpha [Pseudomonadota bacterium]